MKFERNPKYTTIAIYALVVILISMGCYQLMGHFGSLLATLKNISGYLTSIIYGVVFAFLLNPLLRLMDDKFLAWVFRKRPVKPKTRRALGIVLTYILFILLFTAFVALLILQLKPSMETLWDNVPSYYASMQTLYNDITRTLNEYALGGEVQSELSALLAELASRLLELIQEAVEQVVELVYQSLGGIILTATSITTSVVNALLGLIVSIYILFDREKLFAQLKKIGTAIFPANVYQLVFDIAQDINRIFSGFVIGKVIDSFIIGILCAIGLSILKMPYAVLVSVIVGVTNVIPYFGPFIGAIPGFLIIFIVSPAKGFWFLVFVLLLQQLDGNVIGPKILGDTVGLSPLWIIFSIMLFSGLLGIMGMFIGVPLFAIIYSLVKRFVAFLLGRKGHSTDTRNYDSDKNPLIR